MAKFMKKPIIIDAIQWTGKNIKETLSFVTDIIDKTSDIEIDRNIIIHTLEGDIKANVNDWIIKGIKGEFYSCKPDIFEATHTASGLDGLIHNE